MRLGSHLLNNVDRGDLPWSRIVLVTQFLHPDVMVNGWVNTVANKGLGRSYPLNQYLPNPDASANFS